MTELGELMRQQITRGVAEVFRTQREIAETRQLRKTGSLISALASPSFRVVVDGGGVEADSDVPLYIRFLDMKSKGNNRIYNRVIYGVMGVARRRIQYGFSDEVAEQVRQQLVAAGAVLRQE